MFKNVTLSGQQKSIKSILSWYNDHLQAINEYRYKIIDRHSSSATAIAINQKFKKMTLNEVTSYFDESEDELERLVCLDLISATEAFLRIDYLKRVKQRDKSQIGRVFREVNKKKGRKISLEEDIVENWKVITSNQSFSNFLGLLKYRHWLAHGRYWLPKLGRAYSFEITFEISSGILDVISKLN